MATFGRSPKWLGSTVAFRSLSELRRSRPADSGSFGVAALVTRGRGEGANGRTFERQYPL